MSLADRLEAAKAQRSGGQGTGTARSAPVPTPVPPAEPVIDLRDPATSAANPTASAAPEPAAGGESWVIDLREPQWWEQGDPAAQDDEDDLGIKNNSSWSDQYLAERQQRQQRLRAR